MFENHEIWLGWPLLVALGCGGNSVDLGARGESGFLDVPTTIGDPLEPQTVFESEDMPLYDFTVEDTTLYALVAQDDGTPVSQQSSAQLLSCPIDRCKSQPSILSNRAPSPSRNGSLGILGDWLYWRYRSNRPADGVAACRKNGCDELEVIESVGRGELAADGDYVYWVDADNVLQRWKPGSGAPEPLIGVGNAEVLHLAVTADYVYFTESDLKSISRMRKDGSGEVEIVASSDHVSSLEVTRDAFYYTSQVLTGKVESCPLDGCGDGGRDLASNQRWPSALSIASDELFWVSLDVAEGRGGGTLFSCTLPACAQPRVWRSGVWQQSFVEYNPLPPSLDFLISQRYVWWLEGLPNTSYGSALRRLPR